MTSSAHAQAQARPKSPGVGEPRFVGVDFPSWLINQSVGTTSEYLRAAGTGAPVCVPWESVISVRADQVSCWCWTQNLNTSISAPTGDGGCQLTDAGGPDGAGACIDTSANERAWMSPAWEISARRPGARGYAGTVGGVCSVATTTTAGFGSSVRPPCTYTADCTTVVGSGTCTSYTSALPSHDGRSTDATSRDLQYAQGCAYLVMVSASASNAFIGARK